MPRHLRQTYIREVGETINLQIPFQVRVSCPGDQAGGSQGPTWGGRKSPGNVRVPMGVTWDPPRWSSLPLSCTFSNLWAGQLVPGLAGDLW